MEISKKSSKKAVKTTAKDNINDNEKHAALESTIASIEKAFGKGSIMKLGDRNQNEDIPVIPTGALSLDIALGVGGIPKGRIVEVFGPESSGKTTIALHIVAEAQKSGGICGYVDAEHALDPVYAQNLGVKIDELYISQPDDGEQALEIAEAMVRSSVIDVVIVDSVAALTPRAEIEGNMGDSHMGLQARLMSQALRKITAFANKTNCSVIFINQLRDKIGGSGFGGPSETTTGGRALKFYASIRLDIRRIETLKIGENFIGNRTKVKVAKNKVAPPFKTAVFDIIYGQGISNEGDILDMATDIDIVTKSGAWYSYNGERMGQGRENAKIFLKEHTNIYKEIENLIRAHYGVAVVEEIEDSLETADSEEEKTSSKSKKSAKAKEAEISTEFLDIENEELENFELSESEMEDEADEMEDMIFEE